MKTKLLLTMALLGVALAVRADLTAIVTPGYQFPTDGSVAPSYNLLNLLGQPTIQIFGTVGGSNTLAAGSVTGNQLSSSVADGATIGFNSDSPPGLRVLAAGIAGDGLLAQGTTNLMLWADTNLFELETNSPVGTNNGTVHNWLTIRSNAITGALLAPGADVQAASLGIKAGFIYSGGPWAVDTNDVVQTNAQETLLSNEFGVKTVATIYNTTNGAAVTTHTNNWPTLSLTKFTSGLVALTNNSTAIAVAHGLGVVPSRVRWVLVNQIGQDGYNSNDEVTASTVWEQASRTAVTISADATNAWLSGFNGTSWSIYNKTNGTTATFTPADWQAKCYAWP
ncbi:MAG: hypothetical protein KGL39_22935 [Patescibacteria group bacterium]|nr:hypothetical protein [Patescibacteria group bacterium]